MSGASGAVLCLMAKAPVAGRVKTRLQPALSAAESAAVQRAFILDVAERALPFARRVAHVTRPDHPLWTEVGSAGWEIEPQVSGDLGQRLRAALGHASSAESPGPVVFLGTDSPSIPLRIFQETREALDANDVVLGPALDGGYYLIAMARPSPRLLAGISWGTSAVARETLTEIGRLGLDCHLLPYWYDVDRVADLRWLRLHCAMHHSGATPWHPPRTLELVEELDREESLAARAQRTSAMNGEDGEDG